MTTADPLERLAGNFMPGYLSGYIAGEEIGFERGYRACDQELAAIQRAAARQVHAAARDIGRRPNRPRLHQRKPWPDETGPIHPHALFVVLTPAEQVLAAAS